MTDNYHFVIVGGGPAGASAAFFAARAGLRTLVLDADRGMTRRALINNLLRLPGWNCRAGADRAGPAARATCRRRLAEFGGYYTPTPIGSGAADHVRCAHLRRRASVTDHWRKCGARQRGDTSMP
jgi:glycine/D-amino acid oxidase-like deaminating enzyme